MGRTSPFSCIVDYIVKTSKRFPFIARRVSIFAAVYTCSDCMVFRCGVAVYIAIIAGVNVPNNRKARGK
jgi:hypothetical protein